MFLIYIQILFLVLKKFVNGIEYPATFQSCPTGYQRINNGCYMFETDLYSYETAKNICISNSTDPKIVTHLIAFEALAETISLSFWFRGFKYNSSFWTDGFRDKDGKIYWSWSGHDYTGFGYFKADFLYKNYLYLRYNSSNLYELNDDNDDKKGFICEAQMNCDEVDNKCRNNGTCYINGGRVLCKCPPGFAGSLCEILIDNCESVPCLHGASCNNLVNNYTCNCTEFYEGRNCETEIPFRYQNGRITALSVSVTLVGLILLILCLMDLPWKGFIKRFFPTKEEKERREQIKQEKQEIKKRFGEQNNNYQENHTESQNEPVPTKSQIVASEAEMLNKFKQILNQNNTRKSARIPVNPEFEPKSY